MVVREAATQDEYLFDGTLSPRQLDEYHAQGFLIVPRLWGAAAIGRAQRAFKHLERRAQLLMETADIQGARFVVEPYKKPGGGRAVRIHRVVWCGGAAPALLSLGRTPSLLQATRQLLANDDLVQIINQAHFKLPGDGVAFGWHQDSSNRRYGTPLFTDLNQNGSFVQSLVAIDPMHEENGPLEVLPGSHKRGHIPLKAPDFQFPLEEVAGEETTKLVLEPGDVAFMHPFLIHCSQPNTSFDARRVLINGFTIPGASRREYPGCGLGVDLPASSH